MAKRVLPTDQNSFPIQTLAIIADTVVNAAVGAASVRVQLPQGATGAHEDIVRVACNTDCHIRFGDDAVTATATDSLFTQGVEAFKVPDGATHLAVVRESSDGIMTITELT